jgi:hypothetical protein
VPPPKVISLPVGVAASGVFGPSTLFGKVEPLVEPVEVYSPKKNRIVKMR